MKKILVINGVNLNMLGVREPNVYGEKTLDDIEAELIQYGEKKGTKVHCYHSNSESEIVERIHSAYEVFDGIIINAGAYSHYSYAIRDALSSVSIKSIEVHISNVFSRETFRHESVIASVCVGYISGLGSFGYKAAIDFLLQ